MPAREYGSTGLLESTGAAVLFLSSVLVWLCKHFSFGDSPPIPPPAGPILLASILRACWNEVAASFYCYACSTFMSSQL